MVFEWDDIKSELNLQERGFGFDVAARIFAGRTIERVDARQDYGEVRVQAIGEAAGLILLVVYTDRSDARRIISARLASRKERDAWHA